MIASVVRNDDINRKYNRSILYGYCICLLVFFAHSLLIRSDNSL